MKPIVLAHYLQVIVNEMMARLPKIINWSTDGLTDHSDSGLNYYIATFKKGDQQWDITPGPAKNQFDFGVRSLTEVDVSWTARVNFETGDVWAEPTFSGHNIDRGPTDLQGMCVAMGIAKPRLIGCLGPLTQLGIPNSACETLAKLGIEPSTPEVFVRTEDLEGIRRELRQAYKL